jgi:hypothetical protein
MRNSFVLNLLESTRSLHAPMFAGFRRGISGLGASIPISLTVDNPNGQVGKQMLFRVIGAPPGKTIFWSSYLNGKATGELNASYGQKVESNGTAELSWIPSSEHEGEWIKEILIADDAGNHYTAMVRFNVAPAVSTPTPTGLEPNIYESGAVGSGLFSPQGLRVGNTNIPYWWLAVGVGAFLVLKKK